MSKAAPSSADDFLAGLKGQRVLVTAGAGGIGLAIADTLSRLGARIAVCDVSDEALAAAPDKIALVAAVKADVSREDDVDRLFETVKEKLGGLDALINNAGIAGPTGGVDEIDPAEWRRCIDICLTGQFLCARRAVPLIKAAGGGSIVSMSSAAGRHGYAFRTPYSAAKFGVIGFTQSLAKELAARHQGQRHPARHHRGTTHRQGHRRPGQATRRLERRDDAALSPEHLAAPHDQPL
jgi:NAD(P)-dependent dehydrogenase (short-subunit alcohol dehydrogenase family)